MMRRLGLVVLLSLGVLGCADKSSREFAVTITDALEIECKGVTNNAAFESETVEALAKERGKAWEKLTEVDPPAPEGRRLWVNELDLRMEAWFEPMSGAPSIMESDSFDSPLVVYSGSVNDGFIEGEYVDTINTDVDDEDQGRELCGDRVNVSGTLTVTDKDGIEGRIRWTELSYISAVVSSCHGWIECVRDIRIEGLEVE
jgi:hypothetical protein